MTPHKGNTFLSRSSQQLPRLRLGTLEGLFELTLRSSRALDMPRKLLPEHQRMKDIIRRAASCAAVPGHCQKQLTKTLIVLLLKTQGFTKSLGAGPPCGLYVSPDALPF